MSALLLGISASSAVQPPQKYHIDTWPTDKGLPHSTVTSIVQTSDGYLWIGTQNGLARFDGVQFKVFDENNVPAIRNSRIVQLFEDSEKSLWIGTEQGGLVRLRDGKFTAWTLPSRGTTHNYVRVFCQDAATSLWLISCEWQLIHLDENQFSMPSTNWGLSGQRATALAEDRSGRVWAGTERELAVRENGIFRTIWSQTNESGFQVEFMAPGRDGGCWVAGNGCVRKFNAQSAEEKVISYEWTNRPVYDLYEDTHRQLWIATLGSGLFRFDRDGKTLHLTTRDGLPTDFIRCITEDREGDIWVGTEGGGLCRLKPALFETIDQSQGLASSQVMSVSEAGKEIWIGSNGDGLDCMSNGVVKHYGPESGLKNGHVWAVAPMGPNEVWAGTWDGLFEFDGKHFRGLSDGVNIGWQVLALYPDRHGDLWVGQQAFPAVTRLHHGVPEVIKVPDASSSFDIRAMIEDATGAFWIGTAEEGLFKMKDGKFMRFGKADGLGSEAIWCLHVDESGRLWVGTSRGGLSLWRDGRFTTWTTREGLVNNVICQILEDDAGNLWLGSYAGVFSVRKDDLLRSAETRELIQCQRYGLDDGLPSIECQGGFQPSGCRSADGRLWFPTVKGLAVVDPKRVVKNPFAPPVLVEDILIDGVAATRAGGGSDIRVKPGAQRLEFHYTALSFAAPNEVRFRYRMEGLEKNWLEAGNQRFVSYSHVPPGDYRFHVIACNNDGIWNETGAILPVVILPHFWQTTWFFVVSISLLVGIVGITARKMEARRMIRRLEIAERARAVEQERTRIAKDMHDSLGANLTEIAMLSELAQNPAARPEQVSTDILRITTRARELTRSLDEIVWAVNPQNDTLESFVAYACTFAEDYLRLARVACRLDVPDRLPEVVISSDVRHNLFLIVKESVYNVVKHADATEVRIGIEASPAAFAISIRDDGHGIRDGERAPGRNGMINMRKRMENIGGRFMLQSSPSGGVLVRVELDFPR